LIVISPQQQKYQKQIVKKHNLSFDVLEDKDNKIAEKFGLVHTLPNDLQEVYMKFGLDLVRFNGNDSWKLPMPARYIVDSQGVIRNYNAEPDYTNRPEPSGITDLLKGL